VTQKGQGRDPIMFEMAYGEWNDLALDVVACASLLIRNWLHIVTPLSQSIKLLGNIEKQQI